jgi:site-specific recombinase XerD
MQDKEGRNYYELEKELLGRMAARGCSEVTITEYRYLCSSIINQMKNLGHPFYTKEGGTKFLESYIKNHEKNQYYENLRTVVSRLDDLIDGTWLDVHSFHDRGFDLSDAQKQLVDNYCYYCHLSGRADGTVRLRHYDTELFFSKLNEIGCTDITQISPENISKACIRITDHNIWGEIRIFLRYLFNEGILPVDFSTIVPHYKKPYVLPTVYSVDEIHRLESVIDQNTELGLRDYAMILMATRLGLRSGDIVLLRKDDVDFYNNEVRIIQQKTKKELCLPLLPVIKEAIQIYLKIRSGSDSTRIFLNVYAPFHPVTTATMRHAVTKYLTKASVDISSKKHGPHALRSSLASSMVNDKVPYEVVRKILGHSSNNAIKHYARIDIEELRNYSLKPFKVSGGFRSFLYGEEQSHE